MAGTVRRDPMKRRGWMGLIVAGFVVSIIGIVVGLQPAGPLCGSPLVPKSTAAEMLDTLRSGSRAAADCYRSIDSAAVPVWILIVLGVIVVLTGVIIRVVSINRYSAGNSAQSVAPHVEDLRRTPE